VPHPSNTLYYGDNLPVLREYVPDASVDLIYLDPPFNSNRSYNVLFKDEHGLDAEAQIAAFADSWQGKKGSDKGIDGIISFTDDASHKPKRALVQVKSGQVKSGDMRDLAGTVEREGAAMGVFVTLEKPSADMQREAVSAGFYRSPGWQRDYPKIQILTIAQLLGHHAEVKMPPTSGPFKQAQRAAPAIEQHDMKW
jgi:hypothetical protein